MQTLGIVTGVGVCRSGTTLLARILGHDGTPITRATLSTVAYTVRDLTAQSTIVRNQPLTIASVIFDDLTQDDPRWGQDSADQLGEDGRHGYNFLAVLPATLFTAYTVDATTGAVTPHRYHVDVDFTPVSGEPFAQAWEFVAVPNYGG